MSIKLLVEKKKRTKTHPDENRAVPTEANGRRRLGRQVKPTCCPSSSQAPIRTVLSLFRFHSRRLLER